MTSAFKKWLSTLLAILMVLSPLSASIADEGDGEYYEEIEQTEVYSEPEPEPVVTEVPVTPVPETPVPETPVPETPVPEAPATEVPGQEGDSAPVEQPPVHSGEGQGDGGEIVVPEEGEPTEEPPVATDHPVFLEPEPAATPEPAPEPVIAVAFDLSHVVSPVYVPYGTPAEELPLPETLPARFSDDHVEEVSVVWICSGNTVGTWEYIPACEDRSVVFYFQATPVGTAFDPCMVLPAVTVMYEAEPEPALIDHEGISFAGTDMLIAPGATVSTDDILNEYGYDAGYRIVNEGAIVAGASGAAIPNPLYLSGSISGGTFDGKVEVVSGRISGGTFNGRIECASGKITGGTFNAPIGGLNGKILVTIEGGEFHGDIGVSERDGYVFIEGGTFYCNIQARNLAVGDAVGKPIFYNADGQDGERKTVTLGTVGVIAAGTFYADVLNRNNITGGTFYGKVTNGGTKSNCNVLGGTFYGDFDNAVGGLVANSGTYGGARFPLAVELENQGVIDAGETVHFSDEMVVVNGPKGTIKSGSFPCKVVNYGTIAGGNFSAGVYNLGAICGGSYTGEMYNEGGTISGADLDCRLMSNTGLFTLDGVTVDEDEQTVTVSTGTTVSVDELLAQLGEGAAAYTVKNEGTITAGEGEAVLPCAFASNSSGAITGGAFSGIVYAGTISGGTFSSSVYATEITGGAFNGMATAATISGSGTFEGSVNAGAITGGTFKGYVAAESIENGAFSGNVNVGVKNADGSIAGGVISGGTFQQGSVVTSVKIVGGTFDGRVTSVNRKAQGVITIEGGVFNGGVATVPDDGVLIHGGTFNCDVGYCIDAANDIYDGYVIVREKAGVAEPKFTGSRVGGRNVAIGCGDFSANTKVVMYTMGNLAGGTYHGPVICHNAITGGTFYGDVTMNAKPNGQIHGGTFYGHVHNKEGAYISTEGYGENEAPKFLEGEIENEGVMDPGDGTEFGPDVTVVNRETGSIRSGVFNSPVSNYGALSGGVYKAPVTTYRSIGSTPAAFQSAVMSVPTGELTIPQGETMTIEEIKAMDGYTESVRIINRGTIDGSGTLPNTITLIGNYEGGKVQDGVIASGNFTGEIQSYYGMITGGTFSGNVVAVKGISAEAKGVLHVETSQYTTLVITIAGGTFSGNVGEKGTGHVTVTGNPELNGPVAARNLNISGGTFNKEVEVSTVGTITGGTFNGPVTCNNAILGGEFHGDVTIATAPNGQIFGGKFYGTVHNKDNAFIGRDGYQTEENNKYGPPEFLEGEVDNASTMDPGAETIFAEDVTVVNQKAGSIKSGVYRGPVRNFGTISNAVLYGNVENEGMIVNSVVLGKISGNGEVKIEGVTLDGTVITIESGRSVPVNSIKGLIPDGNEGDYIIINKGTITAGAGSERLGCAVVGGVIAGGSFSGAVYAKVITGGSFTGAVHDLDRDSIRAMPDRIRSAADAAGMTSGAAITGGLSIQGGSFFGTVGGQGEAVFIHGGDFGGCTGVTADNLTVDAKYATSSFGSDCRVEFVKGDITTGNFAGEVLNRNNVTGGTFTGKMINYGTIYGGSFSGGIENHGTINGGATYTAYSEDWTFDYERNQWQHHGDPSEERVTQSDVTIDCELTNYPGGVVIGIVNTGSGYGLDDQGGKFETSALIGTPKGESKIYTGERMLCGAPVMRTLAAIDEAEHLTSEWAYLDGTPIREGATISSDPAENAFLRTITWDVQNGQLQLGMNWDEATAVPDAVYTSVRILPGTTVSGGAWDVPVVNEGNITGGTFNKALTNKGSVSGATINGAITAEAGTIEKCTFGAAASVARIDEGASIQVSITADGNAVATTYGANALQVLEAVKTQGGYDWYDITGAAVRVQSTDTIPLKGGKYELRKRPVPDILWPTASPIGVGEPLSTSTLTSADTNGTFRWQFPNTTYNAKGSAYATVVFVKNANNSYNYTGISLTKSIPVEIKDNVITITVDSSYKYYSSADPNWGAKVTGCKTDADKRQLRYHFVCEHGEDVGQYALTVEVDSVPANYVVNVAPSTFTIRPKELSSNLYSTSMGTVNYTGDVLTPVPVVKDVLSGRTLVYGTDFTVTYDREIVEAGKYAYTIVGMGNYTGSFTRELSVAKGQVVVRVGNYTKTYGDKDPTFTSTVVSGLGENSQFAYELYRVNAEKDGVGTYSILPRITKGGDKFEIRFENNAMLTITPKQIPATITVSGKYTYNGSAITPKPAVKDGAKTLVEGTDYTLSYQNNVNAGTATVVVTGKGNYTGTQRASFTIAPAEAEISANDASKPLGTKDPALTATVTGAVKGQTLNYSISRATGEAIGTYAITVTPGKNPNYDVEVENGELTITPEPSGVSLTPAKLTLTAGESGKLTATLLPDGTTSTLTFTSGSAAVATVSNDGSVKAVKAGVTTVTVKTANNKSASCELTVLPVPQTASVGLGGKLTLTTAEKGINAYASSDTSVATVDAKGAITAKSAGSTTITASANGVALAKWDLTVTPVPTSVTLSAAKATLGVGEKLQLTATSDAPSDYSWSSSKSSVATVDANGLVTAKKTGSAKITVKTYNGKAAACTITVNKAPSAIKLSVHSVTLGCGDSAALTATLTKKTSSAITYETTDARIASVSGGRIVAGSATGTVTITARTFNGKTDKCTVTVCPAPTQISIGADLTLGKGQAVTLQPTLNSGSKGTITYASSDAKTVSVTAAGKVTGVKAGGSATITATAHNGVQASIVVTVKNAPSKVTLSAGKASIGVGQTYTLTATLPEGSISPIAWSSSKSSVASVSASGVVTAKKAGKATITAKAFNGKKAACTITVTKAPTAVALSAKSATLGAGDSLTLKATLSKGSSSVITWTSSNDGVATVENGKVTATGVGNAAITATTHNGKTAICSVTVAKAPSTVSLGADLTLGAGQSVTLQPVVDSGAVATFSYSTSNAKVVALSGAKATAKAAGTAKITVTTHNGKTASCTINVTKAPSKVALSAGKASIGVGQTYRLTATLTSGTVSPIAWSSSKSSVASVDASGLVTAKKAGSATITAKTYNGKKATCKITVTKAPTAVALNAKSLTLGMGASATLKATLSKGSTSPITWSSNNAGVVSVENGKLTAKGTGSATITATTYNGKSATCSVTVVPAPTSISFSGNQTVKVKKSVTLKPILSSGSAATLTYKSSNTKVATVDASGKVTGKKAGTATITVTTHNGLSATCTITVKK